MPRKREPLEARDVAKLPPGNHADPGCRGLYVRVNADGRSFAFRYARGGRSHWLGLGSVDTWSLAEARRRARGYRQRLDEGADLVAEIRAEKAKAAGQTFRQALDAYLEAHRAGWRNEKHGQQWENTLVQHAGKLMTRPVVGITTEDVLAVLKPIWTEKTETASRVRGRIEAVLDAATVRGWRTGDNPARWRGHLDALLPAKGKIAPVEHQPAVPYREMPGVLGRLLSQDGTSGQATAFIAFTAARSAEARLVTWQEIDLEARTWTIPAVRMKAGRSHRVALSGGAVAVLARMAKLHGTDPTAHVFPGGRRGTPLSDVAVSKALHNAAGTTAVTVHGLRSSFRDWCSESGVVFEVAEACLAHAEKDKTVKAYARSDLLEQRRTVMDKWAVFLAGGE